MFFITKKKKERKTRIQVYFLCFPGSFYFLKRKTVFKNYKQTILNLGKYIMKFNLKIVLNSDGICDAPFPGDPVEHRQPAENYMSHIMRPIHE